VAPLPSLLVAVLTVALPALVYTGTLMTETVFYPVFLCTALALVLALERPTLFRQGIVLAVCVVAFLTRTQAVVLFLAVATAPVLLKLFDRRRSVLPRFAPTYGALVALFVGVVVVQLARGKSPYDVLGAYSVTGHAGYNVLDVLRWFVYHVAELDLSLAVLPFAAFVLVVALVRVLDRRAQIFIAASLAIGFWLLLEVAAFASRLPVPPRVEERNMFYVAPLLLIALVMWIERGLPRPATPTAVAAMLSVGLLGVLPYERLIDTPAQSDTVSLVPLWWLQDTVVGASRIALLVVGVGVLLALLLLSISPRWAYVLPALVLVWFGFANERLENSRHGFPYASKGARFEGNLPRHTDWVDRAVGRNTDVPFIWWSSRGNARVIELWENELFNRSVGTVYDVGRPSPGDLPEAAARQQRDGTFVAGGSRLAPTYVLAPASLHLAGKVVRRDARNRLVLLRAQQPLHIAYRVRGLYGDTWSHPHFTYTRYRCRGGTVTVDFSGDAGLFKGRQTVSANGVKRSIVPPQTGRIAVPLHPGADGICQARFTVTPTLVPAHVSRASNDDRALGVHVTGVAYTAP
jgi:hypothetical protein